MRPRKSASPSSSPTSSCRPDYVGAVLKLCNDKRGRQKKMLYVATQVSLQYELPMAEVVLDFFDRLKSVEPRLRLVRL